MYPIYIWSSIKKSELVRRFLLNLHSNKMLQVLFHYSIYFSSNSCWIFPIRQLELNGLILRRLCDTVYCTKSTVLYNTLSIWDNLKCTQGPIFVVAQPMQRFQNNIMAVMDAQYPYKPICVWPLIATPLSLSVCVCVLLHTAHTMVCCEKNTPLPYGRHGRSLSYPCYDMAWSVWAQLLLQLRQL